MIDFIHELKRDFSIQIVRSLEPILLKLKQLNLSENIIQKIENS